ncbi:MAG: hypothetical protein Q8K85_02930, partial [Hyphomicrobium sp.]|nr:hypothetical protein [Hyphomicrobium sp.]
MAFEKHEVAILALMFDKKDLINEVDVDLFEDPKVRDMFLLMQEYKEANGELSTRNLSVRLDKDYEKHMQSLRKYLREPPDESLILKMIANKIVKRRILEIVPQLSNLELDDFESLKRDIIKAESL